MKRRQQQTTQTPTRHLLDYTTCVGMGARRVKSSQSLSRVSTSQGARRVGGLGEPKFTDSPSWPAWTTQQWTLVESGDVSSGSQSVSDIPFERLMETTSPTGNSKCSLEIINDQSPKSDHVVQLEITGDDSSRGHSERNGNRVK
jgi:hypothetical protein